MIATLASKSVAENPLPETAALLLSQCSRGDVGGQLAQLRNSARVLQQKKRINCQSRAEAFDNIQGWITAPAFDLPNIGVSKADLIGQRLDG